MHSSIKTKPNLHYQSLRHMKKEKNSFSQIESQQSLLDVQDPEVYGNFQYSKYKREQPFDLAVNSFFRLQLKQEIDLQNQMSMLYKSGEYKNASLYGFNLESLKKDLHRKNKSRLAILWSLYQTLNWQSISFSALEDYIVNFPSNENEVESISLEKGQIKFKKLNNCLTFDLQNRAKNLEPFSTQLQRFHNNFFTKSISKIVHELKNYQFGSTIRQLESNQHMIAVRTDNAVHVINIQGSQKTYPIPCRSIKVAGYKCFVVKNDGTLSSIFIQTAYQPKLNQIAFESNIAYSQRLSPKEFLVGGNKFIGVCQIDVQNEIISLRHLEGKKDIFKLCIEKYEEGQQIINRQTYVNDRQISIILFLGEGRNVKRMVQYRFLIM